MNGSAPFRMTLTGRTQALQGPGLHSGRPCAVILGPGAPGSGLVFQRADRPAAPDLPARWDRISPAERCTALGTGDSRVAVVEHLLAACVFAGLDDAALMIEGGEVPAVDGSARPFVEQIGHVGLSAQPLRRSAFSLRAPVEVSGGSGPGWTIRATPAAAPSFTYRYRGGGTLDGAEASYTPGEDDPLVAASARTFCFEAEIAALRARGLGLGGSAESVLVLGSTGAPVHGERMPGEAVRHKLLDLIGDCALAGGPVLARIAAEGSGHAAHAEFLRVLMQQLTPMEEATPHA